MLALLFAVLAWARVLMAQDDNPIYNVFGSVAFIRSGERTPILRTETPILTAHGAQQMLELGKNFRQRYLVSSRPDTDNAGGFGVQNIPGMEPDILNDDQLFIQTLDKPHLVASAQAFMQGLYPPYASNATSQTGVLGDAVGEMANGDVISYPLDGYQYPKIQALSDLDPQSVYIAGENNCPTSNRASALYEITDDFLSVQKSEQRFYGDMDLDWFEGHVQDWMLDYRYAYELNDYLSYAYNHNATTFAALSSNSTTDADVLNKTRWLADQDAYYRYGNTSSAGPTTSTDEAMAGKTLAALILGQFQKIITNHGNATNGVTPPLSLLFGDFEPLLSFFSVANVDFLTNSFHAIPPYASAMILELYTMQRNETFPDDDDDDLWVRFYFHNGTEGFDDNGPIAYSMFRRGHSQMDMKWTDFEYEMSQIMVNQLADWCSTCSSGSLFCWGVDNSTVNILLGDSGGAKSQAISPAVGGVIGAVVTLAVAGLAFAIAMLIGGIRFHRVERRSTGSKSPLGGFKGSAKLASDPDVSLSKNGAAPAGIVSFGKRDGDGARGRVAHERVGSWELRQKEMGPAADLGGTGDLGDESRRESFEAIEAAMQRPVQPSERV